MGHFFMPGLLIFYKPEKKMLYLVKEKQRKSREMWFLLDTITHFFKIMWTNLPKAKSWDQYYFTNWLLLKQ